jgi:CDP-diacylglycerol--glycerol-3-phosphate 3-phosphatidyltransferase
MMTIPNALTLSRIALIPVFIGLFYLQPDYYDETLPWINNLLVAIFIIISLTDFFDGLLARKLKQISELGAFLDPVADKLMVCVTLIMLTDYHHTWLITIPTIIIIFREILVSALREWMAEIGKRSNIAVSNIGKSKTFMQMLAILFLLYQQPLLMLSKEDVHLIGVTLLFAATVLTLWSGFIYLLAGLKTFDS